MSVVMQGRSLSPTKMELIHTPSGARIVTSAPLDNGGDGSSFSPTDLCAVSLGACASTIMGMYAQKNGVALEVSFEVQKEMRAAPRSLARLTLAYSLKTACDEEMFQKIVSEGRTCPVRLSLAPEVEVVERYERVSP